MQDEQESKKQLMTEPEKWVAELDREKVKRKLAEDALRETEECYRNLMEHSRTLICTHDLEGRILSLNAWAAELLGYSEEAVLEMNIRDILAPEVRYMWAHYIEELQRHGAAHGLMTVQTSTGEQRVWEYHNSLHAEGPSAPFVRGLAHDITEHKRTEAALMVASDKWQATFDAIKDPVALLSPDCTVRQCNRAFMALAGKDAQAIIGRKCFQLIHHRDHPIADCPCDRMRRTLVREETELSQDNRTYNVAVDPVLAADGRLIGIVHTMSDITERKGAKERLEDSAQLLQSIIQGYPIPAFMIGKDHRVIHWNRALEELSGIKASAVIGTSLHWQAFYREERPCLADLIVDGDRQAVTDWYAEKVSQSIVLDDAYEATLFFPDLGQDGKWLHFTATAVRNSRGMVVGAIETLEDVTDREKAQEILRESESRYRAIFENTGAATVILEENTIISIANAEFEKLTGYTRDEIENKKSWMEFVAKEDRERMLDQHRLRRADSEVALKHYEFQLIDRHGETRDILLTIDVIPGTKRSIASLLDITDRKRAEEAVRELADFQQQLIDALPVPVFYKDLSGRYLGCNKAFETLLQKNKDEIIGKSVYDISPDELADAYCDADLDLFRNPGIQVYESAVMDAAGGIHDVVFHKATFARPDGSVGGLIGAILDISESKRVEDALRKSEREKSAILDAMSELVFLVDADLKVIWSNSAIHRQFGIFPGQLEGHHCYRALHNRDKACRICPVVKAFETGKPYAIEDFSSLGKRWTMRAYPLKNDAGHVLGTVEIVTDITERKRAEEAVREAEKKYRSIFENAIEGIYQTTPEGRYLSVNPAFARMFGFDSPKQMIATINDIGRQFYVYPEDRERLKALLAEKGEVEGFEAQVYRRDGRVFWIMINARAVRDDMGAIVYLEGTASDISERKRAEEALEESKRRLSEIIDFAPDATFAIDREGRVIAWNRAIEEMTGVRASEMLGKGNYEYSLPFYGVRRPILIDLVFVSDEEIKSKYHFVRKDGEIILAEADVPVRGTNKALWGKACPLYDKKGNIVGAIESIRDITDRRGMEESLRRAEEKYRSIFENAVEGIFQSTSEGRFLSVNPAFAQILGYDSPDEVIHSVMDIANQLYENPEERADLLRLLREHGTVKEFEMRLFRKDRSTAWVTLNARMARDSSGKVAYFEGTVEDITDRKAMESRLIQAQKIEAIGTLAGGIAHDFNNILSAVVGYTELARGKIEQPVLRGYLEQVLRACERARELVSQILAFSRVTEQERKPVDIASLIKESLQLLRATIPSTITIHPKIQPGAYTVLVDPTQIHQVLINLCTNAAHAMRERGGELEVCLDNLEITPQMKSLHVDLNPGPYVNLTVSDTGTGIAAGIINRIFDPFFTTKATGEGTGLGLSVAYGIVKGCGGTITVNSQFGVGSVFSVYLPAIGKTTEAAPETVERIMGGTERILFVDDEEMLVKMSSDMLDGLGYTVTATTVSTEAVELFRSRPDQFDLVITDMTMPGMTGIDLSKEILEIRPTIPIILCTGFSELITEEKARAMGIKGFAMKPLSLRGVAGLIREVLEGNES
jgi:PAS domain S-box-containing protein